MLDQFNRKIDYLRISLTDRCNLRCRYCMPEVGVGKYRHQDILRFEEVDRAIRIFRELGFIKFRFTGGEPLLRRGVFDFFESLNFHDYYITTALAIENLDIDRLNKLEFGGLNVSCDSLRADRYRRITRRGNLEVFLSNLRRVRVKNLKLNMVVIKNFNEDEIVDFIKFGETHRATVRFIEKMDFGGNEPGFSSLSEIKNRLIEEGIIKPAGFRIHNSVSEYYPLTAGNGKVGFITPISRHFCDNCGKIRLKANGELKLCVFAENNFNLRDMLRKEPNDNMVNNWLNEVIQNKPFNPVIRKNLETMAEIGG